MLMMMRRNFSVSHSTRKKEGQPFFNDDNATTINSRSEFQGWSNALPPIEGSRIWYTSFLFLEFDQTKMYPDNHCRYKMKPKEDQKFAFPIEVNDESEEASWVNVSKCSSEDGLVEDHILLACHRQ